MTITTWPIFETSVALTKQALLHNNCEPSSKELGDADGHHENNLNLQQRKDSQEKPSTPSQFSQRDSSRASQGTNLSDSKSFLNLGLSVQNCNILMVFPCIFLCKMVNKKQSTSPPPVFLGQKPPSISGRWGCHHSAVDAVPQRSGPGG